MTTDRVRILLVDDHPLIREGLSRVIESDDELEVCEEASSLAQALDAVQTRPPDLVMVDLTLEDGSGLDLVRDVSRRSPPIPCLVVSMHEDSHYIESAFKAGARGYLLKRESIQNVGHAIRQIMKGNIYTSQQVVTAMVERLSQSSKEEELSPKDLLTDREYEIFQIVGQGLSRAEMAELLSISAKTVDTHIERIKEKLHLESTFQLHHCAIKYSLKNGGR